jgi:uncharacterized protein (TIGR02145 family)
MIHRPSGDERVIGKVMVKGSVSETKSDVPPSGAIGAAYNIRENQGPQKHRDESFLDQLLDSAKIKFPNEAVNIRNAAMEFRRIGARRQAGTRTQVNADGTRSTHNTMTTYYQYQIVYTADVVTKSPEPAAPLVSEPASPEPVQEQLGALTPESEAGNSFTDSRDQKVYRTVRIGNRIWMAQNLNHQIDHSWCYDDNNSNCARYGRLYTYDAAMSACPAGWRLPTNDDWKDLVQAAGGQRKRDDDEEFYYWSNAGRRLKSKTGWRGQRGSGNGTDNFGFSAMPGGFRRNRVAGSVGFYGHIGDNGDWWSATEGEDSSDAYSWNMHGYDDDVREFNDTRKGAGRSVRCIQE